MPRPIFFSHLMPRLYRACLAVGMLMCVVAIEPAVGQSTQIVRLNDSLQQAVSRQDWNSAISIIDQMIIAAPERKQSLEQYRSQLASLQSKGSQPQLNAAPSQQIGRVPIKRRENGVVIIDSLFNNRQNFEMLLDSGASMTVITRPVAKSLGIRPEHVIRTAVFSTANGRTEMPIVYVQSITVGGLVAKNVPVAIAGPDMDMGLLGQDFLQRYDVTIKRDSVEFNRR